MLLVLYFPYPSNRLNLGAEYLKCIANLLHHCSIPTWYYYANHAINRLCDLFNSGEEPRVVISTVEKYPTLNKTCNNASKEKLVKKDYDLISQVLQKELNKRK